MKLSHQLVYALTLATALYGAQAYAMCATAPASSTGPCASSPQPAPTTDDIPLPSGRQYIKGVYDCRHFSADYNATCKSKGILSYKIEIGDVFAPPECDFSHAMNIVAVSSPPGANSQYPQYCAVEPQDGTKYCWQQYNQSGPSVPRTVIAAILKDMKIPAYCAQFMNIGIYDQK